MLNYLIESGKFKDKDLMSALLKFHSDDWDVYKRQGLDSGKNKNK